MKQSLTRSLRYCGVFVFFLVLVLPTVQLLFKPFTLNLNLARDVEFRERQEFPSLTFEFPQNFDRYLQDNFGFRDLLVLIHNTLTYRLFGDSPTNRVVLGKDGWLFGGRDAVKMQPFSASELELMRHRLEQRAAFLKSRGIEYVVLVIPSKHYVYPEMYPPEFGHDLLNNRAQQFITFAQERVSFPIVYPLESLQDARRSSGDLLYRKTDGHWTQIGAFVAYEELTRVLSRFYPQITPIRRNDLKLHFKTEEGALGRMLGVLSPPKAEKPVLKPSWKDPWYMLSLRSKWKRGLGIRSLDRTVALQGRSDQRTDLAGSALVYRDSFFASLFPYVSRHFTKMLTITSHVHAFDPLFVELERPNIVIDQFLDVYLSPSLPGYHDLTGQLVSQRSVSELGETLRDIGKNDELLKLIPQTASRWLDEPLEGIKKTLVIDSTGGGFSIALTPIRGTLEKQPGRFGVALRGVVSEGVTRLEVRKKRRRVGRLEVPFEQTVEANSELEFLFPFEFERSVSDLEFVFKGTGTFRIKSLTIRSIPDQGEMRRQRAQ